MSDQTSDQTSDQGDAPGEAGTEGQPTVHCHTQYVKDLSFENPNAAHAVLEEAGAPDVAMNVQVSVARIGGSAHEVTLQVEGKATREDKHLFMVELTYAGIFSIQNIPQEHVEAVLYVHCTTLLFPFARQIIAEVTRNGGYPPLLLNAVDFSALYQSQIAARRKSGDAGGATA